MNFGDWASAVQDIAAVAAILVGAAWAYYKFIRGRTFHRRSEVTVKAELVQRGAFVGVRILPTLKNTGGSDIPLRAKIARVYAFTPDDVDERGRPNWAEVANIPVFTDHKHIESEETITDDVIVKVPSQVFRAATVALRATCFVFERRKKPGGIQWTAHAIIPVTNDRGGIEMGEDRRSGMPQEEADESFIETAEQDSVTRQLEASEEEIKQAEKDSNGD
jgi:hypothetical protein